MSEQKRSDGGADLPRPKHKIPLPPAEAPRTAAAAPPPTPQTDLPRPANRRAPAASVQRPAQPQHRVPQQPVQPRSAQPQRTLNDDDATRILPRSGNTANTRPLPPPPVQPQPTPQPSAVPRRTAQPRCDAQPRRAVESPEKQPSQPPRPARQPRAASSKKRRKKHGCLWRSIISMLTAAAVLFGIYSFVAIRCIKKLQYVEPGKRTASDTGCLDESYVRNVLLIGSDSRDNTRGRSDTMMLVSINKKTDRITLTSFLRDSYVSIPGHGENRLNAAYSFGGPDLLLDTIQNNYKIIVDDYVEVNFISFASIVDAVGGVKITVTDEEATAINNILRDEVNGLMGDPVDADWLKDGGTYALNGKQALSFARIRKVGNADFQRTERQREVITGLVSSLKESGAGGIKSLMSDALPNLSTNMETGSMYGLSLRAPFLLGYDMAQLQIPADGTWKGETINGASVLTVDFAANRKLLQEQLYSKK